MSSQDSMMSRRSIIAGATGALGAMAAPASAGEKAVQKGRLKQSVCKWCYRDMTVDELAENGARIGLRSIELLTEEEWNIPKKHGLACAVGMGICSIEDGLNVKANHSRIEANFRRLLPKAAKDGVPNLICFSGNRRDISDEEAWENCALMLNKVKAQAEDLGVTILMELLNSKVNHPDYHCDRTPWGVELMTRVESPRVKLLYDIYHMQIMEGDVIRAIRDNYKYIAHFHTGGNPGRHEIDETQELYYPAICRAIVDLGFEGYLAQEFIPTRDPVTSLAEAAKLCDV